MKKRHYYTDKEKTIELIDLMMSNGFKAKNIEHGSGVSASTIRELAYGRHNNKYILKTTAEKIESFFEELCRLNYIVESDKETQANTIDNIEEFAEKGFDAFQDEKDFGGKIEYTFDDFDKDTHFNNQIRILNVLKDILNLIKVIFFSYIGYIVLATVIALLIIKNI